MEAERLLQALKDKEISPQDMMGAIVIDVATKENSIEWTYRLSDGRKYKWAFRMDFDL